MNPAVTKRKKRVVVNHSAVEDFCRNNPTTDSKAVADHFKITVRTAQLHLKTIKKHIEMGDDYE